MNQCKQERGTSLVYITHNFKLCILFIKNSTKETLIMIDHLKFITKAVLTIKKNIKFDQNLVHASLKYILVLEYKCTLYIIFELFINQLYIAVCLFFACLEFV